MGLKPLKAMHGSIALSLDLGRALAFAHSLSVTEENACRVHQSSGRALAIFFVAGDFSQLSVVRDPELGPDAVLSRCLDDQLLFWLLEDLFAVLRNE